MQEAQRKVAVVREQQHATGRVVEAPNRHQANRQIAHQRRHRAPPFWIICRADDVTRFVHQDVDQRLSYDPLAVHLDALLATVGLGSEFSDDTTVDTHPTSHDEFFRFAPRS